MAEINNDNIVQLDFSEEMKTSYRDYAMSVIIARALPDVRDGLKPVQRRILFAMSELGLAPDKPHRKSARIVGDTMGKYHPHGDSSIYDALVHLTESYSLSVPLVDGHGNFGSIDGDGAAAMRYTEARLSPGAMTLLNNLEKGLVDFIPNFDESEKEPSVLPAMLPNLLINGTTGIAVGMATNIPPHNLGEMIDATIAYMDRPSISTEKLMEYLPGPDFPTGGTIINQEDLLSIYEHGEGRIRVRANTEIENGDYGRKNIIITEIPYTIAGNKTKLVESLVSLMKDKVFDEIYDVRDESSKEGIRIVIEVKKDRDINNLLNGLYKKTSMEDTYSVNFLAVKEKQPFTFGLKQYLEEFLVFQEELYTREYRFLLNKARSREEIVSGLIKATDIIDLIIEILRGSSSVKQAKGCLIGGDITDIKFRSDASRKEASELNFTERQADAILAMPLSRLIGLEILKLKEEEESLAEEIANYEAILGNPKELLRSIKNRLKNFRKLFASERRTKIASIQNEDYVEKVVVETVYVLIDRFGYVKSIDDKSYARLGEETLQEFSHVVSMQSDDSLCVFTSDGSLFRIKASAIPRVKLKDKGALIQTLCKIGKADAVCYAAFESVFDSALYFATKKGYVKIVSGAEFDSNRTQIASTKLEEGDEIISVTPLAPSAVLSAGYKVIMLTEKGLSLGYPVNEISLLKKTSRGVKGIDLGPGDSVVYSTVLPLETETFTCRDKVLSAKKVRNRKRGAKGQKAQL
ncbi:DNA topoisomerase (ATP-hydrolyzing) [Anaerolentibacter hominis]|uniref:DNA gyrase/topoisomerase IV subunit A n=1 Tax=Anaerolentibacter hominis TaxID=3079009 RepID=UPI0031B82EF8